MSQKFEWFFEDSRMMYGIQKTYKPKLLRSDYYDHLGEMYQKTMKSEPEAEINGLFIVSQNSAYTIAHTSTEKTDKPI